MNNQKSHFLESISRRGQKRPEITNQEAPTTALTPAELRLGSLSIAETTFTDSRTSGTEAESDPDISPS